MGQASDRLTKKPSRKYFVTSQNATKGKLGQFKKQGTCYWISPESQIGKFQNFTWAKPQFVYFLSENQGKYTSLFTKNECWLRIGNENQPKNQRNDSWMLRRKWVHERTNLHWKAQEPKEVTPVSTYGNVQRKQVKLAKGSTKFIPLMRMKTQRPRARTRKFFSLFQPVEIKGAHSIPTTRIYIQSPPLRQRTFIKQ